MKQKLSHTRSLPDEQQILDQMEVRPAKESEFGLFNHLIEARHYLKSSAIVCRHMRYVAEFQGQWLAIASWSAPARHIKARDQTIGWDDEQRRRRLDLLVNNSRLLVLPECRCPYLISRFMKWMIQRLCADWQQRWGFPVILAETFVDSELYQGTAYKASAWTRIGETSGYGRRAKDYYLKHDRPKDLWIRELRKGALEILRAETLPTELKSVEERTAPRCTTPPEQIRSIRELFDGLVVPRRKQSKAYPLPGLMTIVLLANFFRALNMVAEREFEEVLLRGQEKNPRASR